MLLADVADVSNGALIVGGALLGSLVLFSIIYDRCISARASWRLLIETLKGIDDFVNLVEQADAVRTRVGDGVSESLVELRAVQPRNGAGHAVGHAEHKKFRRPWLIDATVVLSVWRRAHDLEISCWKVADQGQARERLYGVRGNLATDTDAEARSVVTRIDSYAHNPTTDPRPLLADALRVSYDHRDTFYESLSNRQTTGTWYNVLGAALIVLGALAFHRESLLLFGALGGFLSRASRLLRRRPSAMDYGVSAVVFLLAPVVGALSGWAGVAIVQGLVTLKILNNATFGTLWDHPDQTAAFAVAFAFGFVERLIDRVAGATASVLEAGLPKQTALAAPATPPVGGNGTPPVGGGDGGGADEQAADTPGATTAGN